MLGLLAFAVPVLVTGLLLMAYNLARFGSPFDTGYHFDSGEGFTTPIWQGFWGLLFSPYRSVFLHTPLFIASAIAFVPFVRRHRSEGIVIGARSAVPDPAVQRLVDVVGRLCLGTAFPGAADAVLGAPVGAVGRPASARSREAAHTRSPQHLSALAGLRLAAISFRRPGWRRCR